MSVLKPLKRFIICYNQQVDGELKKKTQIIIASTDTEAVAKVSNKFNIPNKKITRSDIKQGWLYCNEVYNPNNDDIIAVEKDQDE